ncbi:MAG TPA: class I SAM-dependent methyltransferase [Roseiarcus sp.]
MSAASSYALGYSAEEERRLALQGRLYERLTEDVLRHAGIGDGMHVLDVGCGIGDVSLLAARLVGSSGSVIGIDRAEESIQSARRRAMSLGIENVTFIAADISTFATDNVFDAIIGRLVLLYLPDPSKTLRHLSSYLHPGGLVAFQEMDMSTFIPPGSPALMTRVLTWAYDAFGASGAEREMGPKLPDIFINAGLPRPEMIAGQKITSWVDPDVHAILAGLARSLLPVLERSKIATAKEVDVDTLADRLRDEGIEKGESLAYWPRLVGAWARTS